MSMVEGKVPKLEKVKPVAPLNGKAIKAQASTPQDHVFEGPGAGKSK